MKIKINQTELKEILDKHFGGIDTFYDLEIQEGSYAIETRLGKEKVSQMMTPPETKKVAMRGIFPNMGVLLVVEDTDD